MHWAAQQFEVVTSIQAGRVWEPLHERFGEDLRAVTRYEGADYDTVMREDIRAKYSDAEDQTIVDETVVSQLGQGRLEGALKTGPLEAMVRVFDEAWVLSWPDSTAMKSGFIVSLDRGGEAARIDSVEEILDVLEHSFEELS